MHIVHDEAAGRDFFASFMAMMQSTFFVNFLCYNFLVGAVFSHLVWFFERNRNAEQFPPDYLDGIDDGFWWASVIFTTVGYDHKAPRTPVGRLLSVAWMLIGVTLCSILSGHMATSFTTRRPKSRSPQSTPLMIWPDYVSVAILPRLRAGTCPEAYLSLLWSETTLRRAVC